MELTSKNICKVFCKDMCNENMQCNSYASTRFFPLSLKKVQGELPFDPEVSQLFADICFIVEGHEFMCHKVKC